MERSEKLRLSSSTEYGNCFKQGLFVQFYEQSLFWFATHIKLLKPMLERVKGGEPVVYGGLPVASFEKLLEGITGVGRIRPKRLALAIRDLWSDDKGRLTF